MERRELLRLGIAGVGTGVAGCMGRETVASTQATPTIEQDDFYHVRHDLSNYKQLNLSYTVTASGQFDVFVFGGMSDPAAFGEYQRAVRGESRTAPGYNERNSTLGVEGSVDHSRPFNAGPLHFVVDNTGVGEASPTGMLRPSIDLRVRKFILN